MTKLIDVEAVLALSVNSVSRRFAGYVDRDDLISEGRLWLMTHTRKLNEYLDDENMERAWYRLRRDLTTCMEIYARREKSQQLGYDPDDEIFYATVLVAALLPAVVLDEWEPPPFDAEAPRGRTDPAEGGSWHAARADVSRAWERAALTMEQRECMVAYYVDGYTLAEIGADLALDQSTISRRLKRGIRKVVNELGGERPRGCPYDCECHDAPLRERPGVKSNRSGANQMLD